MSNLGSKKRDACEGSEIVRRGRLCRAYPEFARDFPDG